MSGIERNKRIQHKGIEGAIMKRMKWVFCPVCGNKTRLQIREDTVLENFPLYCPKCKQERLIDAKALHITVVKRNLNNSEEPDA